MLGLKHKGDIASEPSRGLGWKALLQGQVGQAPEEQARLLSPRSLTWLGPGQGQAGRGMGSSRQAMRVVRP